MMVVFNTVSEISNNISYGFCPLSRCTPISILIKQIIIKSHPALLLLVNQLEWKLKTARLVGPQVKYFLLIWLR
jgi:hypothetical protein